MSAARSSAWTRQLFDRSIAIDLYTNVVAIFCYSKHIIMFLDFCKYIIYYYYYYYIFVCINYSDSFSVTTSAARSSAWTRPVV